MGRSRESTGAGTSAASKAEKDHWKSDFRRKTASCAGGGWRRVLAAGAAVVFQDNDNVLAGYSSSGSNFTTTVGMKAGTSPSVTPEPDGTYEIDRLPVGESYTIYAEPLNGVVDPSQITPATALCRNSTTDPGWPPLQGCTVPAVDISFTTRTLPGQ